MNKKTYTLLNILNTDKGGRLLDNTNGPSTPSLLASLIGKSTLAFIGPILNEIQPFKDSKIYQEMYELAASVSSKFYSFQVL